MERKLVKQGRNALTVTLPSSWIKKSDLKAGDTVDIELEKNDLIITSEKKTKKKEITINAKKDEVSYIWHLLLGYYIDGYDYIHIKHENKEFEFGNKFPGMIVEKNTSNEIILRSLIDKPEDNLDVIIKRTTFIFLEHVRLLKEICLNKITEEDMKKHESLMDENINYCLRFLNKYEIKKSSYKDFLFLMILELAADQLTTIGRYIEDIELANKIIKGTENYINNIIRKDFEKLYIELREFRNSINKENFVDGLAYTYAEILYDKIGFLKFYKDS